MQTVLLLTDGMPTIPACTGKSYVQSLRDYIDQHPKFRFQMNTFGFGYSLDSKLLLNLAEEANGAYAFIPVAPNVGTFFTNVVANVVSTFT